ncbi:hypothetical protein DF947_06200 [Pedobacter paludis]|uniref:Uncharacterized protein n=2 Tax=Pedobacter paludis TaxID=2203212 RepID=A0A317F468_9SPHI|nr:hypothetical protein DF947_06200 [Pedobacter paludis]
MGIYFAYYGLNLVFDLLNAKERPENAALDDGVLHFTEDEPELIIPAKEAGPSASASAEVTSSNLNGNPFASAGIISSGAASLKQLFELAKNDLIEYTKAISY